MLRLHKVKKRGVVLAAFLFIFSVSVSELYSSPLTSEGGIDTYVYKSDTVLFEATALDDGGRLFKRQTFDIGFTMLHSPYLTIAYVPIKYSVDENFQVIFSLPYITKTVVVNDTHYIKSGYGDTMLGLTFSISPDSLFTSSTTARVTLPTGNVNAQSFDIDIPMGYGGYTASLQESLSSDNFNMGSFSMRFFLSAVGIYYSNSSQESNLIQTYDYKMTYAWAGMGGVEFKLSSDLDLQVKANYIDIKERKYKVITDPPVPASWTDADDSVKQINAVTFVKYRLLDDLTGQFGIIYPVKSFQDKDIEKTYDAKWKAAFSFEKKFSSSTPSSYKK